MRFEFVGDVLCTERVAKMFRKAGVELECESYEGEYYVDVVGGLVVRVYRDGVIGWRA